MSPVVETHKLRSLAEDILRLQKRPDSKTLAVNMLYILDVFERLKKQIYITGRITESQFDVLLNQLELEYKVREGKNGEHL